MPSIEINKTIEVEIDVYCDTCGSGLCGTINVDNRRGAFRVPVCQNCIDEKDLIIKELEDKISLLGA